MNQYIQQQGGMTMDESYIPNVWIEKTSVNKRDRPDRKAGEYSLGKALWSPTKGSDGRDTYSTMRLVNKGDLILHLVDNLYFSGISIVEEPYDEVEIKLNTPWDGNCYLIKIERYIKFENPIKREEFLSVENLSKLNEIAKTQAKRFYTLKGELQQGAYLTPCGAPLLKYLNNIYRTQNGSQNIPYIESILQNTEEVIEMGANKPEKMLQNYAKNMILYGPPGTGKTYNTVYYSVAIIEDKSIGEIFQEDYFSVLERYNRYKNVDKKIAFTAFHQSYGYEEFIEGIKPFVIGDCATADTQQILYEVKSGVFKEFCETSKSNVEEAVGNGDINTNRYVFIIDEINRGNISKIFGELITLVESTKRMGEKEEIVLTLPYSNQSFGVPNNIYILGTMNTADRSIALLDTALRRRFDFVEMMPDTNALEGIQVEGINIKLLLESINQRIEALYDREHTIGHAYFTCLKENSTLDTLASIFENEIIPLLQEYFYEDYYKIQLVLSDNIKEDKYKFILDAPLKINSIFNCSPDIDFPEKRYTIQKKAFEEANSYIKIYKD